MSQIFDFTGDEEFYHGGSIYSSAKEAGSFLSLGTSSMDVFFPRKRARVISPFVLLTGKKQVSIDSLPDECLYEILRRVPSNQERSMCAGVSKRWLTLLSSIPKEELCRKNVVGDENVDDGFLTRSLHGKKATDIKLAAIALGTAGCGGLGELAIRGSNPVRGVSNTGLKAIARCCQSLKVLSLTDVASIGDEGLIEVAKGCPQLENLHLSNCPAVTDKALVAIVKNCPSLKVLSLDNCQNVGNDALQAIGKFCSNLKTLIIENCPFVSDLGVCTLMSSPSFTVKMLKLEGLNVTDVSLAAIGHYGKAITVLELANLQNVTERGFWAMGKGQGLLRLYSCIITSCRGVTDLAIDAVGKGCPNLKQFVLKKSAFLSDNGLMSFAKSARFLESFILEECHRITQIGFFGLLMNCGSKLKTLAMSNCFGFKDMILGFPLPNISTPLQSIAIHNCPGLGDMTLAMVAKLCPHLQNVTLQSLPAITDAGILSLVESADVGDGLVRVCFAGCINVTDTVIVSMVKAHGGTLEELNLNGCVKVTDVALSAISSECLVLSELDVSKCAITDFGVTSLARAGGICLRFLGLSGCSMLSDKCLPFLAKVGQYLRRLNLKHCNSISSTMIYMLQDRLVKCDIFA